jgi:hypothetical protein
LAIGRYWISLFRVLIEFVICGASLRLRQPAHNYAAIGTLIHLSAQSTVALLCLRAERDGLVEAFSRASPASLYCRFFAKQNLAETKLRFSPMWILSAMLPIASIL